VDNSVPETTERRKPEIVPSPSLGRGGFPACRPALLSRPFESCRKPCRDLVTVPCREFTFLFFIAINQLVGGSLRNEQFVEPGSGSHGLVQVS